MSDRFLICVDCAFYVANADLPDDEVRAAEVRAGVDGTGWVLDSGEDGEHDHDFSWRACDACGSRLGGARMAAVIL